MQSTYDETILNKYPKELRENGFIVLKNGIRTEIINRIGEAANELIAQETKERQEAVRSLGSLISTWKSPAFIEFISDNCAITPFKDFGAAHPRYSNGYVFSKPPHSPPAFWHQDWWLWQHPLSYSPFPHQLGLLCFLGDTSENGGCLRVIPGSHRRRHKFHDLMAKTDLKELRKFYRPEHELYQSCPEQVPVPVKRGDLVIIDARLLHGSFPNNSSERRTLVTFWYYPFYDHFDEPTKATIERPMIPDTWPDDVKQKLAPLLTNYSGTMDTLPFMLHPSSKLL